MSKVIISGISGQDGSYMAEYLLDNTNHEVVGGIRRTSQAILKNLDRCLSHQRFRLAPLDLCDNHSITELIKKERPDYFINFGATTFVPDSWNQPALTIQVNSIALIHILEAVRNYTPECRIYSAGSSEQMGDVEYSPQDEKHPMRPRSVYGVSKCVSGLISKVYRESYGLYVVHGILFNHESERRQSFFVTKKITEGVARISLELKQEKPLVPLFLGNIDSQRDWSSSKDFVDGIWKMLNQSKPIEYILSSGETHSVREFTELAFKFSGYEGQWYGNGVDSRFILKDEIVAVEIDPKLYSPADVELLWGDSTRARTELGWKPKISFQELVQEMVQHDLREVGLV